MQYKATLCGSVCALILTGAAADAEDLTIWTVNHTSDKQVSALNAAECEFEKRNPGMDVEIVMHRTDEHWTALRVASGSDADPDIYGYWADLGLSPYYDSYG
jgi:raffinose/stachyose/melibiose transport system substrate-binding protein